MPSPSPPTKRSTTTSLTNQLLTLPQTTNLTISHLIRLLTSTPHLDTLLLTSTYTLRLLHSLLTRLPQTSRIRLTTSLSPLSALIDEFRTMLRLFGLLSIYNLAVKTWMTPVNTEGKAGIKEWGMRSITWAQIASLAVFQALENGAFLAGKGVLAWKGERVGKAYKWGARAWMAYVMLEFVRLANEYSDLNREASITPTTDKGEKDVAGKEVEVIKDDEKNLAGLQAEEQRVVKRNRWDSWKNKIGVNAAYAPMTVHYSIDAGAWSLSEGGIGALGCVVAWLTMGRAWRESA